jgi:hypothetical protein
MPDIYIASVVNAIRFTLEKRISVESMIKEHHHHICFYHLEKSAFTKHTINPDHHILLHDTSILAKKSGSMNNREATKIKLQPNIINRRDGFSLMPWMPLIHMMERKKVLCILLLDSLFLSGDLKRAHSCFLHLLVITRIHFTSHIHGRFGGVVVSVCH